MALRCHLRTASSHQYVCDDSGWSVDFTGDGFRQSTIGTVTTTFVGSYDEKLTNGAETKYYYAGAQRIAMQTGSNVYYLPSDQLGSSTVTATATGGFVSEMRYTRVGEVRYPTTGVNPGPSNYTYTGQYSNVGDFGLMFYNARWYDPALVNALPRRIASCRVGSAKGMIDTRMLEIALSATMIQQDIEVVRKITTTVPRGFQIATLLSART